MSTETMEKLKQELFQELKLIPGTQINGYVITKSYVIKASCQCPHMIFRIKFSFVEESCKNLLACVPGCIFTHEMNFKFRRENISIKGTDVKLEYFIDIVRHKK